MLDNYLKMRGEEIDTQDIPRFLKRADFEYTMIPTLATVHCLNLTAVDTSRYLEGKKALKLQQCMWTFRSM